MTVEEMKVRLWRHRWLSHHEDTVFLKLWHQTKNLVPNPLQFPELAKEEWDEIKMLALLDALERFNPAHVVKERRFVDIPQSKKYLTLKLPDGTILKKEVVLPMGIPKTKVIEIGRESEMTLLSYIRLRMTNAV